MNWQEIAGSVIQAFRNAGVKKDVIDLQEKQLGLLTKQIITLESEKSDLLAKISNLEKKTAELELELERLRPKTGAPDEMQIKFLQLLFKHDELPIEVVARQLGVPEGMANYHRDVLLKLDFVEWANFGMISEWMEIDRPPTFGISTKGRAYLVENHLV